MQYVKLLPKNYDILLSVGDSMNIPNVKVVLTTCGIIVLLIFFVNCITVIETGEAGLKVRLGQVVGEPLQAGIHMKIPVIESIKIYDIKVQKEEVATNGASKDLQDVSMAVAVNYSINPLTVKELYTNVGMNYKITILQPGINEALKAVTSQYTAEELILKRPEVSVKMKDNVALKLEEYGIIVEDINIIDLSFSAAFNAAIEAKQVAQQTALKAEQDLARVKVEAEQQITKAKAEAESYKLKNQEITDKTLQMTFLEKWDGKLPTITGGENMLFDISSIMKK